MLRKIVKKLNNFRLTATLVAIFSVLTAIYAIGSFACYHFAGEVVNDIRVVGFTGMGEKGNLGKILGMVLFLLVLVTTVIGIVVAYQLFPAIKNKEKVNPKPVFLFVSFIGSFFELGVLVLMVILATKDPNTKNYILYSLPLGGITIVASWLELIPFYMCDFYMPTIKNK